MKPGEEDAGECGDGRYGINRFPADPTYALQDLAPCVVLVDKEMYPVVKRRDGDMPLFAEVGNCTGAIQIREKDGNDKSEGIGAVRNQDIRKERMGVPAGPADKPWDGEAGVDPLAIVYGNHVSFIGAEFC